MACGSSGLEIIELKHSLTGVSFQQARRRGKSKLEPSNPLENKLLGR